MTGYKMRSPDLINGRDLSKAVICDKDHDTKRLVIYWMC